jgi:hypothetical protein
MLKPSEIERIAVEVGKSFTKYLSTYQRGQHLDRVEKSQGIELSPVDRKAVLARADEHRAARSESRPVEPMQAVIVAFAPSRQNALRLRLNFGKSSDCLILK